VNCSGKVLIGRKAIRLKIAFVIPAFLPARGFGGPIYHVHTIAKILQRRGHSVSVYTSNIANPYNSANTLLRKEYVDGILVKRYRTICKIAGYWITPSMLVDLETDDFDIIHAHAARSFQCDLSALVSKLRSRPLVITAHGSLGSYLGVDLGRRDHMLHVAHNVIAERVFRAADKVIALNRFERQHYIRLGVDPQKIAVIPNGIVPNEFKQGHYSFREEHGIEGPMLLFVGRLAKIKGLDTLVQAFRLVKSQNFHDVKLVIVGEDWGFKQNLLELRERSNISDDILILDHPSREDIVSAYQASDMVVLPSNYETFSITILEAFACAKPVIATAVGGIPELVQNGETGLLIRPNDAEELSKAMTYLLREEGVGKKFGEAARWLVTHRFSMDTVAQRIEDLYNELSGRKQVHIQNPS
jgi:glycosyltransferase involved in cell wall biosynthesis